MLNENNLISKSRPLLEIRNSGYNMGEFRLLDTYLSRINPLDPSTARVVFTKEEYCSLLGVESGKIRTKQLIKYTSHFLGNIVTLPRTDGKQGYIQKPLFTLAEYDEEDQQIVLECNSDPQIFNMFFNIENIGYVKYILRNTLHLKSTYSFKLFMLIKSKQPATEFTVALDELKAALEATAPRYEEFKYFNAAVLKKAHQEISDGDDIDMHFEYEVIRKGRTVTAIRFKNIRVNAPVLTRKQADGLQDATPFELMLMDEIPEEVHENDIARVRAINDVARKYIQVCFVDYLAFDNEDDEKVKLAKISEASRQAVEECNERIIDAVHEFTMQEYNIRKNDVRTSHYAYYKAALDGWLRNNRW